MRHETSGKPPATRTASPPGHPIAPEGIIDGRGGQRSRGLDQLRLPMATRLPQEWLQRTGMRSRDWTPSQTLSQEEKETHRPTLARSRSVRLFDGSLDHAAGRRSDRQRISDRLSSQSYLACPDGIGMELPEAGTSGAGTRRSDHRRLEKSPLAGHKKKTLARGAHLVFLDESGFLLLPHVVRTWAPRGQTPILKHFYRRDRVSVISALTLSPKKRRCGLLFRVHPRNIKSDEVVAFLRGLFRHLRGPIVLLWDRGLIHRGKAVKTLLSHRQRVQEEWLPAYAPELNPAEYV